MRARACGLLLWACACVTLPHPTPRSVQAVQSRWPTASVATLEAGRTLLQQRCAECHALRSPTRMTRAEWSEELVRMGRKAHLEPAQIELVLAYLSSTAKDATQEE